jgi:AraC family transcriptional regulator
MEYRNNLNINVMCNAKVNVKVNDNLTLKAPKTVNIEPRQVIYLELTGEYSSLDFGGAYERLWQFVKENKLFSAGIEHLAFYFDDPKLTEPAQLRTQVCLVIQKPAVPKGDIQVKTIEGGKYAKFLYQGLYSNLSAVYDAIFSQWCPCSPDCECYATHESGKCECGCLRDAPCFEKYVNRPDPAAPEKSKTEIYIPIV